MTIAYKNGKKVMTCFACGGTGKYWRPDIFDWWACNICLGRGYIPFDMQANIGTAVSKHPDANYKDYRPVKDRA